MDTVNEKLHGKRSYWAILQNTNRFHEFEFLAGQIPYGLAVRIPGFHPGGPGSTPGMGTPKLLFLLYSFIGHVQSNLFNTDTIGKEPNVRFTEVPYYRGRECIIFGISGTKRTIRHKEESVL